MLLAESDEFDSDSDSAGGGGGGGGSGGLTCEESSLAWLAGTDTLQH